MTKTIKLPGLIDPHVHFRTPGQIHKEDFFTGTSAALAGGFTTVLDMPNNLKLIDTQMLHDEKIAIAKKQIVCDVGFYFGSLGNNLKEFPKIMNKVKGLKLFLSNTTGGYILDRSLLQSVFAAWPKNKVILFHAEDDSLDFVIKTAKVTKNKIHICHISTKVDLLKIIAAKKLGINITCGVTPHHLFLTKDDVLRLGSLGIMKPPLASKIDQEFLWEHLKSIDVIESDHAPHTLQEKKSTPPVGGPPFGVPNLETTLPLLLTAVNNKQLTIADIKRLCFTNPSRIFEIPTDKETYIEVGIGQSYMIHGQSLFTKCGWSPFAGKKVKGKVIKVVIRNKTVFENGRILVESGFGKII